MSEQDLLMLGISDSLAQPGVLESDQEGAESRSHLGGDRADSIELGEADNDFGLPYYQNDPDNDTDEAVGDMSDGVGNNLEPSGEMAGVKEMLSIPHSRRSSYDDLVQDNYEVEQRNRVNTVPCMSSTIHLDKPQGGQHSRMDSINSWTGSDLGGSNADLQWQLQDAEKIIDELREWIELTGRPALQQLGELKNKIGEREMRVGELDVRVGELDQKVRYQNFLIQDLQHEKEELQEQYSELNEQSMNKQNGGMQGEPWKQEQNYINELEKERTRYEDLKDAFKEQSANMGRVAAMLTERDHENQTLNQDKQSLAHDYQNVLQENDRLHQRIHALQKKHEVVTQELNGRIQHQNAEISRLTEQLEEMMEKIFQLNENQEMLIMKNEELALGSANTLAMEDPGFYEHMDMGDLHRSISNPRRGHQRENESFFNEMTLEAEMGEVRQNKSSGSFEEKPPRTKLEHKSSRRRRNWSQKELVKTFLNDLKNINSSTQQHEVSSDMSKLVTQQVQTGIQRTLKTFVREDLVATVKSIFSQKSGKKVSFQSQSSEEQSIIAPNLGDSGNIALKKAARDVFREETGTLSKTLELFNTLCSSLDLTMLKSLSDTNTKLVESLCASRESVEVLQNQMQTVIVSHMEEVTSTINELGITDGAEDKANLEKVIRESTMEALTEIKPIPSSEDQEKVDSPKVSERALPPIEKEYQDRIEKLEQENKELTATLSQAGRDKLMAMSRLNTEMDKLRSHIRSLQTDYDLLKASTKMRFGRGRTSREWQDGSRSRSPTNSVTIWAWGNV